jgi:hypothetical protein
MQTPKSPSGEKQNARKPEIIPEHIHIVEKENPPNRKQPTLRKRQE